MPKGFNQRKPAKVDLKNVAKFANEIYICMDWQKFEKRNPNDVQRLSRMLARFERYYRDEMEKVEAYQQRGDLEWLRTN